MFRTLAFALALTSAGGVSAAQTSAEPVPIATAPADSLLIALPSQIMGKTRELNVLLPEGYATSEARYGPTYSAKVRQAMQAGKVRSAILVGIATEDRQNELLSRSTDREAVQRWPNHGQSHRFRRYIEQEVKPLIEGRYRTSGDDAILGESAAALFIVETFLRQPGLFDRYLAVSPSLWWDGESLSREATALLATHPAADKQLLLTIGDEGGEMQAGMDRLVMALRNSPPQGLAWDYEPRHSESHSTVFAASAIDFLSRA